MSAIAARRPSQSTGKRMIGKRLYAVWPLGLALFISACGGSAPPDAVINAVQANRTTTYTLSPRTAVTTDGAIHFKVQASSTNTSPAVSVIVELSGSSPTVGDPAAGFVRALSGGGFIDPAAPSHIVDTPNGGGAGTAFYHVTVPKCGA